MKKRFRLMPSLLFVEDDEDILANLYAWFEQKDFRIDSCRNGIAALEQARNPGLDCIILDILLPGMNGMEVCKRLRADGIQTPIIIITAKDSIEDKVAGLEEGADDYLVKPFSLKELEARIYALMRRPQTKMSERVFGEIRFLPGQRRVFRKNTELILSPASFRILECLIRYAPNLVPREDLEELIWGDDRPGSSALRNQIFELRRVLDKPFDWPMLETIPHTGYRLRDAPE